LVGFYAGLMTAGGRGGSDIPLGEIVGNAAFEVPPQVAALGECGDLPASGRGELNHSTSRPECAPTTSQKAYARSAEGSASGEVIDVAVA
jgi:hypothetical protein